MTPATTGKRRRPASASLSPPPPPSRPTRAMGSDETRWKKRRLESSGPSERSADLERKAMEKEEETLHIHVPGGDAMKLKEQEERKPQSSGKRRRRSEELLVDGEQETAGGKQKKKRRVAGDGSSTSPPPDLPTSPPANLSERHARPSTASSGSSGSEEKAIEEEEKPRFPPPPIEIPHRQDEGDEEEVPKENREDELREVCANLEETDRTDTDEQVRQHKLLRSVQVTPPPSARMLDRKNPPPPPPRPKTRYRRNYRGVVYARSYPRLALSPLVDSSPPTSPRMFRSLENEFAFAMQDTPEIRPQVRPAPRMARGARRSTRAGASRARRSLDTPTSTMVLRSRQLNPSHSSDGVKPENQREREQREAHRRQ